MNFLLLNPASLWVLLGLLVVTGIHLLRQQSRSEWISTFFLLQQFPIQEEGKRIAPLRHSWPLWLQWLAVIVTALALSQPVIRKKQPFSTLVIVLDQSASMSAFQRETLDKLDEIVQQHASGSLNTEWIILNTEKHKLASGRSLDGLRTKVEKIWDPRGGMVDPLPALDFARLLAGPTGQVVFLTDHPPQGEVTGWISIGHPISNVGFSGLNVRSDTLEWSALLRNFDTKRRIIQWSEIRNGQRGESHQASLEAGEGRTLRGRLLSADDQLELRLEPDDFPLDDRLFILCPKPKLLHVAVESQVRFQPVFKRMVETLEAVKIVPLADADLVLQTISPDTVALSQISSIAFLDSPANGLDDRDIVPENDSLMEGLDWRGLLVSKSIRLPTQSSDRILLWQGDEALIFIRSTSEGKVLIWNFDVLQSTALQLPAFVILVYRFANEVRNHKVGFEARLVESGQLLDVAGMSLRRAPLKSEFFVWKAANGDRLFLGAANFLDVREADFRQAKPYGFTDVSQTYSETRSNDYPLTHWLFIILVALLLVNWTFLSRRTFS